MNGYSTNTNGRPHGMEKPPPAAKPQPHRALRPWLAWGIVWTAGCLWYLALRGFSFGSSPSLAMMDLSMYLDAVDDTDHAILRSVEPPLGSWTNPHNLVHVVLTRFMQHQPNLLHLGMARLELFRSFCFPTIRKQTNRQFLWIIRADPNLRTELREELVKIVSGMNSVVVVGSNGRIDDGYFRHPRGVADITNGTVWYGNLGLLRSYHDAAQRRIVLETGLDADDGLALDYIDQLQSSTLALIREQRRRKKKKWWKLFCIQQSTQWQYYGPYLNSLYGQVIEQTGKPRLCQTPGLTRVTTPAFNSWIDTVGGKVENGTKGAFPLLRQRGHKFFVDHAYINLNVQRKLKVEHAYGFTYLYSNRSQAVRARSPTSAGMRNVNPLLHGEADRGMTREEAESWVRSVEVFGLNLRSIRRSRDAIEARLSDVLTDAISGQCQSAGHSCKNSSIEYLVQLRDLIVASSPQYAQPLQQPDTIPSGS